MLKTNSVVAVFSQHAQAEEAVRRLQDDGFDMKKLSIISKAYETKENVVGYYTTGERMKHWGQNGAFWGGIWGMLFGSAFFLIPGVGPLVAAGPVVAWIVGALEGAAVVGGVSVLGAALYSVGIPQKSILEYETSLAAGKFVLVLHGTAEEVVRAEAILAALPETSSQLHMAPNALTALV